MTRTLLTPSSATASVAASAGRSPGRSGAGAAASDPAAGYPAAPLDTRANAAMLPVGAGGQISFYSLNGSDVIADAAGYFLG